MSFIVTFSESVIVGSLIECWQGFIPHIIKVHKVDTSDKDNKKIEMTWGVLWDMSFVVFTRIISRTNDVAISRVKIKAFMMMIT